MIKFKRGSTKSWKNTTFTLAAGQPGYDKDKNKLKIGDGKSSWNNLPYLSGLSAEEILSDEIIAKTLCKQDVDNTALITYGNVKPNNATVGKLYLYELTTESDRIIKTGIIDNWLYKQYESGIIECWRTFNLTTTLDKIIEGSTLFQNSTELNTFKYPFIFKNIPVETVTIQSSSGLIWLANIKQNTETASGNYAIVSPYKQVSETCYTISIVVKGLASEPSEIIEGYKRVEVYLKDIKSI